MGATTELTALIAAGSLTAFALAARALGRGTDPYRLAAGGALLGLGAFAAVILAAPLASPLLFRCGSYAIGFSSGLFGVGTLTAAMALDRGSRVGLALGAWGAAQATAGGVAIAASGALRDLFGNLAQHGSLGPALTGPEVGYGAVYHIELLLLFATLIAIGPLVRTSASASGVSTTKFGLAELPG